MRRRSQLLWTRSAADGSIATWTARAFRRVERAGLGDGARGRVVDLRNEDKRLGGRSSGARQRRLRAEYGDMGDHDPALVVQPGGVRNSGLRRSAEASERRLNSSRITTFMMPSPVPETSST
jgi:hypothetical protein